MKLPLLAYLNKDGSIRFEQNLRKYEEINGKKNTIDIWVINNNAQWDGVQTCQRIYLLYNKLLNAKHATPNNLTAGTQIIYIPIHLQKKPDILNKEIQFGFVTSVNKHNAFCRYYSAYDLTALRTLACSEITNMDDLYLLKTRSQNEVSNWIKQIRRLENRAIKQYADTKSWFPIRNR